MVLFSFMSIAFTCTAFEVACLVDGGVVSGREVLFWRDNKDMCSAGPPVLCLAPCFVLGICTSTTSSCSDGLSQLERFGPGARQISTNHVV